MNAFARIISYVFHPLLMGTYLFALLVFLLPAALYPINSGSWFLFLTLFFIITVVIPVFLLSFLRISGLVKSFQLESRQERVFPFIIILLLYGAFTYILTYQSKIGTDDNVFKFLLIIDSLVLAGVFITLFYKVSVHAIGIMGLAGILMPLNKESDNILLLWITIGVMALAGVVMSARLQLNAHTPRQVLVGALSGFLIGFFGIILLF
ncbi:MAG TPA: phosphatase PAP2 family protein [Cyclobacteriaceae bacterium]|nr:phosphatase PAP2 family protein [Cyclobacteriaceae bacterium]